jgi:hypothetical protein
LESSSQNHVIMNQTYGLYTKTICKKPVDSNCQLINNFLNIPLYSVRSPKIFNLKNSRFGSKKVLEAHDSKSYKNKNKQEDDALADLLTAGMAPDTSENTKGFPADAANRNSDDSAIAGRASFAGKG